MTGLVRSAEGWSAVINAFAKLTRDAMIRNHHLWSDSGAIAVVALWGAVGCVGALRG